MTTINGHSGLEDHNITHVVALKDNAALQLALLIDNVCFWGMARNITAEGGATALTQSSKLFEEAQEFVDATTHEEAKDAIGDCLVVLIQMCRLRGYDMVDCLKGAWEEIQHRKGTMRDGIFYKERQ